MSSEGIFFLLVIQVCVCTCTLSLFTLLAQITINNAIAMNEIVVIWASISKTRLTFLIQIFYKLYIKMS